MSRSEHLRELLERHPAADVRENGYRDRMLRLLERDEPFSKHRFDPGHFTASGFVLAPSGDALLMILHGTLRRWLQPGGHVDAADADILAAARREVAEEVSLPGIPLATEPAALFDVDIHPIPARSPWPAHEHFDVRFLFRAQTLDFRADSDARDARWMTFAELAAAVDDPALDRILGKLEP